MYATGNSFTSSYTFCLPYHSSFCRKKNKKPRKILPLSGLSYKTDHNTMLLLFMRVIIEVQNIYFFKQKTIVFWKFIETASLPYMYIYIAQVIDLPG